MTHIRHWTAVVAVLLFVALMLAACGTPSPAPMAVEPTAVPASTDTPEPTSLPDPTHSPVPESEPEPTATTAPIPEPTSAPEVEPEPEIKEQTVVERVTATFPDPAQTDGQIVLLYGYILDANGDPIPNAAVEIWQTDADGYYDHPRDPSTENRDTSFQFFGTSPADETGLFFFRTISPGYYEPRPRHIHVKVKIDDRVALITQFYFDEDRADLADEGLFAQAGDQGERLILETVGSAETGGNAVTILTNDLVIDTGSGGSLTPTPPQGEGPYYPVVDVSDYDNDLTILP